MGVTATDRAARPIAPPQVRKVNNYLNAVRDYTSPVTQVVTFLFFQTLSLMYPQWFVDKLHIVWNTLVIQYIKIRSKINENRLNRQLQEKEEIIQNQAGRIEALKNQLKESEAAHQKTRDKFNTQSEQLLTRTKENHALRAKEEQLSQSVGDLTKALTFLKNRQNQAEGDASLLSQLGQMQIAYDTQKLRDSEAAQVHLGNLKDLFNLLNLQIEKMDENSSNCIILTSVRDGLTGLIQEVTV